MKKYKTVEVSEKQLEDLIRHGVDLIEDGLRYIDHQRMTDRGPLDVLMVDSGNTLVVAELKVVEDDTMLVQGIDYYDYITKNIEGIARVYKDFRVDPSQMVRLFLIAPSFSFTLVNRCKWLDIPVFLFTYKCITLEESKDLIPVFSEIIISSAPKVPQNYKLEDKLAYITNPEARNMLEGLISEIQSWDMDRIVPEPKMYNISFKFSGKVFCYITPRRKTFIVDRYDAEKKWTSFPISKKADLDIIRPLLKEDVERLR